MNKKQAYSYTVLRYVHDVLTGEFVNVAVVLYVPELGSLQARERKTIGRLRAIFPDLDGSAFKRMMTAMAKSLTAIARQIPDEGLFARNYDALALARRALPADDSSLQWSTNLGSGLTDDPEKTLARLYDRLVARYDNHPLHRRSDDDIWRSVRHKLEQVNLADRLQEKAISGAVDNIVFKHAWKNGLWHVYEPVSFDLADADGIRSKAREWLGHLSAVTAGEENEPFKPHFIVGAPTSPGLDKAYSAALAILRRAPANPEIFEENQVDDLVAQIEDEVRAHDSIALARG